MNQYDRQYEKALAKEHESWGFTEPPFTERTNVTVRVKTGKYKGTTISGYIHKVESAKLLGLIHTKWQRAKRRWYITVSFKTVKTEKEVSRQFIWVPKKTFNRYANEVHGQYRIETPVED